MIAQFSIHPLDQGAHISSDIRKVIGELDRLGVDYVVGPMGTSLQGSPDEVIEAIRRCHSLTLAEHERVVTTIMIDERKGDEHSLRGAIAAVGGQTNGANKAEETTEQKATDALLEDETAFEHTFDEGEQ